MKPLTLHVQLTVTAVFKTCTWAFAVLIEDIVYFQKNILTTINFFGGEGGLSDSGPPPPLAFKISQMFKAVIFSYCLISIMQMFSEQ